MQILDGKIVSEAVRKQIQGEVEGFKQLKGRSPGLAVVLVGKDPASQVYVNNKVKACDAVGIRSFHYELPGDVSLERLQTLIQELNKNVEVDGILVQLPLPEPLKKSDVVKCIDPAKDVDGLLEENMLRLEAGEPRVIPCTPAGVMEILKFYKINPKGMNAVVMGRSRIVGRPMAAILKLAGADVHVLHRGSENKLETTKAADLLVVATGVCGLIGKDDIKQGCVVIDVGIHRTSNGLCGDVRYEEIKTKAAAATPVPGGVGPMTITMLLKNTLVLARAR